MQLQQTKKLQKEDCCDRFPDSEGTGEKRTREFPLYCIAGPTSPASGSSPSPARHFLRVCPAGLYRGAKAPSGGAGAGSGEGGGGAQLSGVVIACSAAAAEYLCKK